MVTSNDLKILLSTGENQETEFKSTIDSAAKIAKTLVAFANTNGGTLLVGITDDGKVCGIPSEEKEMHKIEEASDLFCQPPLEVTYEVVMLTGKKILCIRIEESDYKPHVVKDISGNSIVYVRMHNKSVPTGKITSRILKTAQTEPNKTLLQSQEGKTLQRYLQANEYITPKRYAKLINISERRAEKMLMDFANHQLVLPVEQDGKIVYTQK